MPTLSTTTGFGYIKNSDGKVATKCVFPPGKHPLKSGYTFIEVKSQKELNKIEVFRPPDSPAIIREQKIQAEIWKLAEDSLRAKGEL